MPADAPVNEAARQTRTRDIVVRVLAEDGNPKTTKLRDVCSADPVTMSPNDDVETAVRLMREHALRRLPIVDGGTPVGIVSLGDLAMERDPGRRSPTSAPRRRTREPHRDGDGLRLIRGDGDYAVIASTRSRGALVCSFSRAQCAQQYQ